MKATQATTPARDDPRERLLNRAPSIGAALHGIRTITEIVFQAGCDRETNETEPGEWQEPFSANRIGDLIAVTAVLAEYVCADLRNVINPEDHIDAESAMMWGTLEHLYPFKYPRSTT